MRSAEYWRERFKKLEEMQHAGAVRSYEEIEKLYRRTLHEIEKEIREWYFRFAENNQIPLNEAYRLLNTEELEELKWTVEEYIRYGKQNAVSEAWMEELENASAKAHVNRLEALRLQLQQSAEVLFGNQLDIIDTMLRESYLSSYMHTAYEIQRGVGVAWNLATPNTRLIEQVLAQPWAADGRAYSDRIWSNKQKLLHELNTTLTQNIISGADPQKAIDTIARRMNVSKQAAGRLVMTEEAAISNAARKECFEELGVEEYEIVETLDLITCETCGDLDKQRFPMDKHEIGVTAPPFHPNCRGCTAPYIDDDFDVPGKRFARGADGKGYYVQDMSYKEWRKTYVDQAVEKTDDDAIIKSANVDIPREKLTEYALNAAKAPNKAKAFHRALGYTADNADGLMENIRANIDESKFVSKGDNGYGMRYEYIMELKGINGKKAHVLTAWIQDGDTKRLTSAYVTRKEVTK